MAALNYDFLMTRTLNKNLLIIEDTPQLQILTKRILAPIGYNEITTVDNSESAISQIITANSPTDIYSDFQIHGRHNGLEIAHITAQARAAIGGRLILCSSGRTVEELEEIENAISIGIIHKFITKPFNTEALKAAFKQ